MVLRMQGFDEGVFGGHFHTANAPPVFGIPGLDVLAYSNGRDWTRGLRATLRHAANGGVSMLLDSTALLARKHKSVAARDDAWQCAYPLPGEELAADDVVLYAHGAASPSDAVTVRAESVGPGGGGGSDGGVITMDRPSANVAVATYGNGVVKALEAVDASGITCDVIDVPLLSRCPEALPPLLRDRGYRALLLVDVCREGAGPLAHLATRLHEVDALPAQWKLLTAAPTYNPLGRTLTFVSTDGIAAALEQISNESDTALAQSVGPPLPDRSPSRSATRVAASASAPRALIVCPGRGSYNATELHTLSKLPNPERWQGMLAEADEACVAAGMASISQLDAADKFSRDAHMEPAHASTLTYALAAADFASRFGGGETMSTPAWQPVGVCGNSLGWYTALHLGGALSFRQGLDLVLASGAYQRGHGAVGGQLVYPSMSDQWEGSAELTGAIDAALVAANAVGYASLSIELGGMTVLAADEHAFDTLRASLPPLRRGAHKYPLVLPRHAAFHTPLMSPMADAIDTAVPPFAAPPVLPLVDGAGRVWEAGEGCDLVGLRECAPSSLLPAPCFPQPLPSSLLPASRSLFPPPSSLLLQTA